MNSPAAWFSVLSGVAIGFAWGYIKASLDWSRAAGGEIE